MSDWRLLHIDWFDGLHCPHSAYWPLSWCDVCFLCYAIRTNYRWEPQQLAPGHVQHDLELAKAIRSLEDKPAEEQP